MCGIMGYVGPRPSAEIIYEGLKRLEYRGYDSAGVCSVENGKFQVFRSEGKLAKLRAVLADQPAGKSRA